MSVLNFGSLNADHVYRVGRISRPGETISCKSYQRFAGGKGLNQSIALARAGARVFHAGKIGLDGLWLKALLADNGVDVTLVETTDGPTGHALIQVDDAGENSIVIFGGANREIGGKDIERALAEFGMEGWLLVQNEVSSVAEIVKAGAERGLKVAFNPAPMDKAVHEYPLDLVDLFIVNEVEGAELSGESDPQKIVAAMLKKFPKAAVALTLGARGVVYGDGNETIEAPAQKVEAVDTTGAGDCFIGYLLAGLSSDTSVRESLETACRAAALCVTRPGAAQSIPFKNEL